MLGPIFLVLSMTSLTGGASLAKALFPALGPFGITFLRLFLAFSFLGIFFRPWRLSLSIAQGKWILLYGVNLGLMNLFFYLAIARLPLGVAIALEFLGPLSVALYFSRNQRDWLWLLLAALGVFLLLPRTEMGALRPGLGVLFALMAAAAWAAYILIGKRAGEMVPEGCLTAYGMLAGAVVVAPFGLRAAKEGITANPELIWAALGVGLFSSAIPYPLEILALKRMDTKTFGILLSLEPAIGALMALLFLKEKLSGLQILAIGCVVLASAGSTFAAKKYPAAPVL